MSEEFLSDEFLEEYWKMNFGALVAEREEARQWARRMMRERDVWKEMYGTMHKYHNAAIEHRDELRSEIERSYYLVAAAETIRRYFAEADDLYLGDPGDIADGVKMLLCSARELRDEAREILLDVIIQATRCDDGELDSMALTSYAVAMRYLAQHGLINIKAECFRRVIATLVQR